MACTLSNKCAKNLSKRTVLLQLIIKNVVTCFFLEHSVYIYYLYYMFIYILPLIMLGPEIQISAKSTKSNIDATNLTKE